MSDAWSYRMVSAEVLSRSIGSNRYGSAALCWMAGEGGRVWRGLTCTPDLSNVDSYQSHILDLVLAAGGCTLITAEPPRLQTPECCCDSIINLHPKKKITL